MHSLSGLCLYHVCLCRFLSLVIQVFKLAKRNRPTLLSSILLFSALLILQWRDFDGVFLIVPAIQGMYAWTMIFQMQICLRLRFDIFLFSLLSWLSLLAKIIDQILASAVLFRINWIARLSINNYINLTKASKSKELEDNRKRNTGSFTSVL